MWVVPSERLVRADGGPTDPAWLEEIDLVPRGDTGGCGRCTGSLHGDVQLVFPGDRCPLPAFARRLGEAEERSARLAEALELAYPGACRCTDQAQVWDDAAPPPLRRISPKARLPAQVLSAGSRGHIAGVSNLGLWRWSPDGRLIEREPTPSCSGALPAGLFAGMLRAAAVSPTGRVVVVEQAPRTSGRGIYSIHVFDERLESSQTFDLGWGVSTARFLEISGATRLVLGGYENTPDGDLPRLETCALVPASASDQVQLDCEPVLIPAEFRHTKAVRAIEAYDGHLLLLMELPFAFDHGYAHLILAAHPGPPWSFTRISGPLTRLGPDSLLVAELEGAQQLLLHGRRVSLCSVSPYSAEPPIEREYSFVLETELPARLEGSSITLDWRRRLEAPHDCAPLIPAPGGGVRTIALDGEEPRFIAPEGTPALGLSSQVSTLVYDAENDRSIVAGRDGTVSVWNATRSSTEAYSPLWGGETETEETFCPVEGRGALYAFGSEGTLVRVEAPASGTVEVETHPALDGVSACAYERRLDRFLVAGQSEDGPFARWFEPRTGERQDVELPALPAGARFFRAAGTGWGSVFLLGAQDLVLEVAGARALRLALDWDDPHTTNHEREPDLACCSFRYRDGTHALIPQNGTERPAARLTDLDAHEGAVWLAGRGRTFFRGFPGRLERAAYPGLFLDPSSVRSVCGDVAIAAQPGLGNSSEGGDLERLERGPDGTFTAWTFPFGRDYTGHSSGTPTMLFGTSERLYSTFGRSSRGWGSFQVQGSFERRLLPGPLLGGAATPEGHVLLSGVGGQLYLGVACR